MATPVLSPAPGAFRAALSDHDACGGAEGAGAFAQAIVDTVREPLLVLDTDLRVLAASRSFLAAGLLESDDLAAETSDGTLRIGRATWLREVAHVQGIPARVVNEGVDGR